MIATSPPAAPPVAPSIEPEPAPPPVQDSGRGRLERARSHVLTTPGLLRLASIVIVVLLVAAWIVATASLAARRRATRDAGLTIEPLLVATQNLYTSLADADASAANGFLSGGIDPAAARQRYVDDINGATSQLPVIARGVAGAAAHQDVQLLNAQIPVYTGLVETARTNNRLGFPVGAAYLRQASALMRSQILPASNRLYQLEEDELQQRYASAGAARDAAGVTVAVLVALTALVVTQLWMARRSHRVFNIPLVAATVGVVAMAGWALIAFNQAHHALATAQRKGSDAVEVLSRARALTLQAEGDENLTLVARGTGADFVTDFQNVTSQLGGTNGESGLLADAARLTANQPEAAAHVQDAMTAYRNYLALHTQVRSADDGGRFPAAVGLAIGSGPTDEYPAFVKLDTALQQALGATQKQFVAHASDARGPLDPLRFGVPILVLLAIGLALFGIQMRINDYR
ncbi:MAG TPA: hypothetical protein VGH66_07520 [Acidimicrobiales bacterium]|jgi:GGDEF domain-containing protein